MDTYSSEGSKRRFMRVSIVINKEYICRFQLYGFVVWKVSKFYSSGGDVQSCYNTDIYHKKNIYPCRILSFIFFN